MERVINAWEGFRRALRRDEVKAFDTMMNKARTHSSAASMNPLAEPQECLVMSILLEHEKELEELKEITEEKNGRAGP